MRTEKNRLSAEAEEWHDTLKDEIGVDLGSEPSGYDEDIPYDDSWRDDPYDEPPSRVGQALQRIRDHPKGSVLFAAFALLFMLLALAYVPGWGTDDESSGNSPDQPATQQDAPTGDADPASGDAPATEDGAQEPAAQEPAVPAPAEAAEPPTHAELAAQDPIPLTDGPWRFFREPDESIALYDFIFEPSGRFYESGAEHNEGTYDVNGSTIEMTLVRVHTVSATNADGAERSEEIEWFTMTRTGNTMNGTWVSESWMFSYEDGLEFRGLNEPWTEIFARPQRPDDQG